MIRALREFKREILDEGFGKPIPKGAMVRLHYTGKFPDGRVFDSTYERAEPKEIHIGVGTAIQAWDMGITGLKKGSKATLFCPPEFAYGKDGLGQIVPPNATVIFELEILDYDLSEY
jgi:FKBP-type peptidyl-prolyl cis-trans isomerase